MSGAITAAVVIGTAYSIYQGEQQRSAQKDALRQQQRAQDQALADSRRQQSESEQNINRANRRQPNVQGIVDAAAQAGGPAGTMLTGPMGINPGDLQLGKNTLLGS